MSGLWIIECTRFTLVGRQWLQRSAALVSETCSLIFSMNSYHLPLIFYILIWWSTHLAAQFLTSRIINDGVHGIFLLYSTFLISSQLASSDGIVGIDELDTIAPNLKLCLVTANAAGNLFLYNSMMHIPAYCSQFIKGLEVVFTVIFTCILQQRVISVKEALGCTMIFCGLSALVSTMHSAKKPLCEPWSVGVLEVFMASALLPARNILLKQHVTGALPYYGFVYLCRCAIQWLSPCVLVSLAGLALVNRDSLTFTNTIPRLVMLLFALGVTSVFFHFYNWASLRVLGTHRISVQLHAGLNALKRGVTIIFLYSIRLQLHPGSQGERADPADISIGSQVDENSSELFGPDSTTLSLALVLMVGGCFVTSTGNEDNKISTKSDQIIDSTNGVSIKGTKIERDIPEVVRVICYTVMILSLTSTLYGFDEDNDHLKARTVMEMFSDSQNMGFNPNWFERNISSNTKVLNNDESALDITLGALSLSKMMGDQPIAHVGTSEDADDFKFKVKGTSEKVHEVDKGASVNGKCAECPTRIVLINHTGKENPFHFGQVGASYALELALASHFGLETKVKLYPVGFKGKINISDVDLVVCNAEGTLHDSLKLPLLRTLDTVVASNKRLWIVNFSFFYENNVASGLREIFEHAEFISIRESMSAKIFSETFPNIFFHSAADLTFLLPRAIRGNMSKHRKYNPSKSLYNQESRLLVTGCGGGCKPYPVSKLKGFAIARILPSPQKKLALTPCEAANLMAKSTLLISSRFHATTVATSNFLPSLSFPANTDKLKAMVHDLNSTCAVFSTKHFTVKKKYLHRLSQCDFEHETIIRVREAAKKNFPFHVEFPIDCTKREMVIQKKWLEHLIKTDISTTFTFLERFDG